ncbi:MAG TPA: erythromycin esterase family protein, partial [Thermoanaerobaculia bacterium]|nr:erythromycin esterase family protein [Thermoanaerobaculia bacterium]
MRRVCLMLALCCLMIPPAGADPRPFLDLDFEAPECTSEWTRLGPTWRAYDSLYDQTQASSGGQSLRIGYVYPFQWVPQLGVGSIAQLFPNEQAAGRKIRFSGSIRTEGVPIWAGLYWIAIDQAGGVTFGNSGAEGAGTTPWTRYEFEIDIPADLQQTYFGVDLVGPGTAWFDDIRIEIDGQPWKDRAPNLFEPTPGHAAWLRGNALPLATAAAGNGFADLQPLRQAFGDARIVSLGEATHGTREFFLMKHRLLEFLVEEMGFTHFSIEANMPETYKMNEYVLEGQGDPEELLEGMLFWTWNTQEVLDMIHW